MSKIKEWLKKDNNYQEMIKISCAFLFPLFVCILQCWRLGGSLFDVYLPNSQNNDDLFYFKQVEGMIEYGFPQGYFGYDESHALNLSFGAWGPLTLIVWAIWGKVFGWSISTYYWCNIFFQGLALAFFTYQAKPKTKHMIAAGILIGLFPGFSKYTLSCLVESHIISYLILFYGLALGYAREQKKWKLIGMFVLGTFLTCMRPYLVLLIILPGIFVFLKKKGLGIILTGAVGGGAVALYFTMAKYLTAGYFTALFDSYIFRRFLDEGIYAGTRWIVYKAIQSMRLLAGYMKQSILTGKFMGSNYCIVIMICIMALVMLVFFIKNKEKLQAVIYSHYIVTVCISVAAALILMDKVNEGSRHSISFIIVGCILIAFMTNWKSLWRPIVLGALILFLFYYYPDDGQDYQIPLRTQERYEEQQAWNEIVKEIEVTENGPSYENTVIWAFSDNLDGTVIHMNWRPILAVPKGMGISCCRFEYTSANLANLQSRYIMTQTDGELAAYCKEEGYSVVGEYDNIILFQRY